jgi:ferritin-like metal-binding protein YciE
MTRAVVERQLMGHLRDAVAMEQNVERLLRGMVSIMDDDPVRERIERHLHDTRTQIERLGNCLETYGADIPKQDATITDEGTGFSEAFANTGGEPIGRNAREAYAVAHLEIAAYNMLERVAAMAGDEITVGVSRTNRAEEERLASFLDQHWDDITRRSVENSADEIVPPG